MSRYFAQWALLPDGWARDVCIEVAPNGTLAAVDPGSPRDGATLLPGPVPPGSVPPGPLPPAGGAGALVAVPLCVMPLPLIAGAPERVAPTAVASIEIEIGDARVRVHAGVAPGALRMVLAALRAAR